MGKRQIEVTVTGEQQRDHWTHTERIWETWEAEVDAQEGDRYQGLISAMSLLYIMDLFYMDEVRVGCICTSTEYLRWVYTIF